MEKTQVVLAVDGSENSERAFNCKYTGSSDVTNMTRLT